MFSCGDIHPSQFGLGLYFACHHKPFTHNSKIRVCRLCVLTTCPRVWLLRFKPPRAGKLTTRHSSWRCRSGRPRRRPRSVQWRSGHRRARSGARLVNRRFRDRMRRFDRWFAGRIPRPRRNTAWRIIRRIVSRWIIAGPPVPGIIKTGADIDRTVYGAAAVRGTTG